MRKIFFFITLLFFSLEINAQTLEKSASFIKTEYLKLYEANIKKYALEKWKEDYDMVVYEINKQCDAIFELIEEFKSENTNILFRASIKWSYEGKLNLNTKRWEGITKCDLPNLLQLECDWTMVLYEYKKQVKAKNSF